MNFWLQNLLCFLCIPNSGKGFKTKCLNIFLIIPKVLDLQLVKCDELHCLIQGIHFIDANFVGECYYLKFSDDSAKPEKITYDFQSACPYPFIVVNVGSGVSIMAVRSSSEFDRITGSA